MADFLVTERLADEVWLVVSPQNPLKKQADLADDNLRLQMTKMAFEKHKNISVSDVEFHLPKPSYSIDTLNFLQKQFPQKQFILLIGADNAAVFDKWKNYAEILEKFDVMCYPRKDFPQISVNFPQIKFIDAPLLNISSTQIRKRFKINLSCRNLLPENVIDFIKKNKIY
jgi:nicotinate-nucleotide adenylyltransferase